jgi:hypothetical protein
MSERTFDLESIVLTKGGHRYRADGVCFMEAYAWSQGHEHQDAERGWRCTKCGVTK